MNIQKALQKATQKIEQLDAQILLGFVLNISKEQILTHAEQSMGWFKNLKFKKLVKKRAKGIPIAYLTGHKEFYGLDFLVNKHTLVPRPDTELMVGIVRSQQFGTNRTVLIDVGTGSGCIPISILKSIPNKDIKTFATDISIGALKIAKKNAKKHNVDITFLRGNLLEPIKNSWLRTPNSELIITANLPYLTHDQFKNEPSIQHEPKSALVAENNGLALYEELLEQIKGLLKTYNLKLKTYFEIDPSQTLAVKSLVKKHLPNSTVEIKKDLAGRDRLVVVNYITHHE